MALTVRRAEAADFDDFVRVDATAFNYAATEGAKAAAREFLDPQRMFVLCEGDDIVGCSANVSLQVTLPGGGILPMTGVTWVGVLPTHHRRGGLRQMMKALVEDGIEHGEPVAGLYASESVIYRRFGYGVASRMARINLEGKHSTLRTSHETGGTFRMLGTDQVSELLVPLHEELRRARNGMLSRPANLIRATYLHRDGAFSVEKDGKPSHVVAHFDDSGKCDGLMRYTTGGPEGWLPDAELKVVELWGLSAAVEIALWRFALDVDFTGSVESWERPVDEPIADLLADPRRWRVWARDGLHLRIADVPTFLSARRYSCDDEVAIEVVSPDGSRSTFRLQGSLDGAHCRTTNDAPDLTLDLASLGAISLGDTPLERLWRAGLVDEHSEGSVRRATAMFSWSPLPWSGFIF